jgi:GNAT superfamily N-acetyltransferase
VIVRIAGADDAPQLAALIALLDHQVTVTGVRERLVNAGMPNLVAVEGDTVVGLCGLHLMRAIHRERPVGRVTILVVAQAWRGKGIGRLLIVAAERTLADAGCGMVEITSNDRLVEAHDFYRAMGYDRTSQRFAKPL